MCARRMQAGVRDEGAVAGGSATRCDALRLLAVEHGGKGGCCPCRLAGGARTSWEGACGTATQPPSSPRKRQPDPEGVGWWGALGPAGCQESAPGECCGGRGDGTATAQQRWQQEVQGKSSPW